jgi:hypothetical protein
VSIGGRRRLALLLVLSCGSRSGLEGLESSPEPRPLTPVPPPSPEPEPSRFAEPAPRPEPPLEQIGCVDFTRSYTSVPATVLLLIDQSGSMTFRDFAGRSRWDVLREAVVDPESGLLAWLDQSARVGLMLYTSFDGFAGPGCPIITRVDAEFGNVEKVRGAYLAEEPADDGDTPTGDSIDEAARFLGGIGDTAPKHILLLTDGDPDTCAQPDPQQGLPQALDAAQRAYQQGIRVHTVGVSTDIRATALQRMANAGAGKDPELVYGVDADAEQPLFASSDPRQLADQLKGIIGDVRSCTVELGTTVGIGRALDGRLLLDGVPLENDARDGWTFLDADTLLIHGAACERILGDGERLQVRFPCVTQRAPIR